MKNNPSSTAGQGAINGDGTTQSAARSHIDTEPFKKWFGSSKVVDEQDRPLVVYHGTGAYFSEFDSKEAGRPEDGPFWFARDRASAEEYGEITMPVYLNMANPFRTNSSEWANGTDAREVREHGHDGVIVQDTGTFMVFEPIQIRSAIENCDLHLRDPSSLTDNDGVLTPSNAAAAKSHIDEVFSCEARSRTKKVKP